jgi:membrane protein implicated in regulation of membrane protease activity
VWLLAVLCAVIGIAIAAFDGKFLMPSMEWFVLGILFALLSAPDVVNLPKFQRTR